MFAFTIAICDDLKAEQITLARLIRAYAKEHGLAVKLCFFSSGESLLAALQEGMTIHVLFLDIYMPGLDGMTTARRIRASGSSLSIIFATTSQDHGLDSFEVQACDYLVKPFQQEDVDSCLDWFFAHIPEPLRLLSVYAEGEWQSIPLASIYYINVYGHQCQVHTPRGVIVTRRGLDALESAIDSRDFLRCHRSFLVNLNHVDGVEGSDFCLGDQTRIPISPANAARIRSQFIDWTYSKAWSQAWGTDGRRPPAGGRLLQGRHRPAAAAAAGALSDPGPEPGTGGESTAAGAPPGGYPDGPGRSVPAAETAPRSAALPAPGGGPFCCGRAWTPPLPPPAAAGPSRPWSAITGTRPRPWAFRRTSISPRPRGGTRQCPTSSSS